MASAVLKTIMLAILLSDRMWTKALMLLALLMSTMSASAQFVTVTLAWDANQEADLAGYKLYYAEYGDAPSVVNVRVSSQPSVTLDSLSPNTAYTFYVTAYNTAGLESDPSETITWETPSTGAPRVTTVARTAGGFSVTSIGMSGNVYSLQAKNEVNAPQWTTIDSAQAGVDGSFTLVDPVANLPRRFYRLLQQ